MRHSELIPFIKVQSLGNDFILLEEPAATAASFSPGLVRKLCDRNFGVGADGVLLVLPGDEGHARMRIHNSDGSVAEMCGNGIRCFARYLARDRGVRDPIVLVETDSGLKSCEVMERPGGVCEVRVAMGAPRFEVPGCRSDEIPLRSYEVCGRRYEATVVSMGNPHLVIFVDNLTRELGLRVGAALVGHSDFPEGTNVELVRRHSPECFETIVYERGVGLTLACGTGACAVVAAACLRGAAAFGADVVVRLPGGDCAVKIAADCGESQLKGPAEEVFRGVFPAKPGA